MKTAIGLMKLLVQGEEDLRSGKTYGQDEVFRRLSRRLKTQKAPGAKKAKI